MGADPEVRNLGFVVFISLICIWAASILSRVLELRKAKAHVAAKAHGVIVKPFQEIIKTSMVDLVDEYAAGTSDAVLILGEIDEAIDRREWVQPNISLMALETSR
jgi:hypothetical protein